MPTWQIDKRAYEIPAARLAILDTCVLIAVADPHDGLHGKTIARLDEADYHWAVAHAAYLEAWNFLVGKARNRSTANQLYAWVSTPGNAIILGEALEPFDPPNRIAQSHSIDLVDVSLAGLATRITRECELYSPAFVATYDTGDFTRLYGRADMQFGIFDMHDGYEVV